LIRLASALVAASIAAAVPAAAQTPRDLLMGAAFGEQDHAAALAAVRRAQAAARAAQARDPGNQEAATIAAVAQGYVAKLTGNRGEAMRARREVDDVVRRFPRSAEAQLGQGAWHLAVIHRAGRLLGRVIGAQQSVGVAALGRAVTLEGDRAFVVGVAGMMLIEADPGDTLGRAWVEAAARATASTPLDRVIQRSAARVAAALRSGDRKAAQILADRLLPFGWYQPKE